MRKDLKDYYVHMQIHLKLSEIDNFTEQNKIYQIITESYTGQFP